MPFVDANTPQNRRMHRGAALLIAGLIAAASCCGIESSVQGANDVTRSAGAYRLPNGELLPWWEDTTVYTRIYHVDGAAPNASDSNPGTDDAPLKTIGQAARQVGPGEKVVIRAGVYRELVEPIRGGDGPDKMIAYEAAPGAEVIIRGSRVIETPWVESRRPHQVSRTLWMTDLSDALFEGYNLPDEEPLPLRHGVERMGWPSVGNPFRTQNADARAMSIMPWAESLTDTLPYTLPRGLLFQDGRRLAQLAEYADLRVVPGSYWVEPREGFVRVHIRPFDDRDPNQCVFEATVQQQLLKPAARGLGHIKLRGLTFDHAGNGMPRTGVGAVFTRGGHHWIIEQCTVRQVGSVGIEIGARTNEFVEEGSREELESKTGYHIIRRNTIHDCGTGGIQGLIVYRSLVDQNEIFDCGWQDVERYWETAAIKLLNVTDSIVRRNHIHDITAASGIWLDYLNINSRVTQNVITRVRSYHGGVFLEASQVPNWIDHNFIWDIHGHGVYQHDCDRLVVAHNLIGRCTDAGICMRICQDRRVGGRLSTSQDNLLFANVIVDCDQAFSVLDDRNISAENAIVGRTRFDLAKWQARGLGPTDRFVSITTAWDAERLEFTWQSDEPLTRAPRDRLFDRDLLGAPREGPSASVGPFADGPHDVARTYLLRAILE